MKKIFVLLSVTAMFLAFAVSASAAEEQVVIDNVVYELTEHKTYGQHYAVRDFISDETLAETTAKINIVDEIDGIEVLGINTNFSNCEDFASYEYTQEYPAVKRISIPSTIRYIGAYAFTFFPSVEKLQLPAELEIIGEGAFFSMDSLKSITLPEGITIIPFYTFEYCKNLKKVVFQGDVELIGEEAFMMCENLSSVNFPKSLEEIQMFAFSDTALKKIVLPAGVNLQEYPFSSCQKLEKIVFESDKPVEYIDTDTFNNCKNIKAIYIKAIATKGIHLNCSTPNPEELPNLATIYFEGSEKLWNELTFKSDRAALALKNVNVEFYYKHSHSFVRSGNPTCKKGGTYTCTCECGDSYKVTLPKDPNAHKYGSWKVVREATCAMEGLKTRTCKYCKCVQEVKLNKLYLGKAYFNHETIRETNEVTFSWKAAVNATGYRVYQYDEKAEKYVKLASVKNKTEYTVKNLEAGKTYTFAVESYNKDKNGGVVFASKSEMAITTVGIAPENLQATSTRPGEIDLTWEPSGEDASYRIYCTTSKENLEADLVNPIPVSENKTTVKKLTSGETYYCMVFIYDGNGEKLCSNIVEVTVK